MSIMNVMKNSIICWEFHDSLGTAMIRVTSTLKTTNRIINRKNRTENGFRDIELRFIPHLNGEFLLDHFL